MARGVRGSRGRGSPGGRGSGRGRGRGRGRGGGVSTDIAPPDTPDDRTVHPGGALEFTFRVPDYQQGTPTQLPSAEQRTDESPPPSSRRRRHQNAPSPFHSDADNPFIERTPLNSQSCHTVQFSAGEEVFNFDTSPSPSSPPQTPTQRSHNIHQTPQSHRGRRRARQQRQQKKKTKQTADIYPFFEEYEDRMYCILCKSENHGTWSTSYACDTSTGNWRRHLYREHVALWVEACDRMGVEIIAPAALDAINEYRASKGRPGVQKSVPTNLDAAPFSPEAFVNALIAFIAATDQSINIIESPELRRIFLMLREELTDDDIPHRTHLRECIMETWQEHLQQLSKDMLGALGKISFTCDLWTNSNLVPFMAVTAHWIETKKIPVPGTGEMKYSLSLRADLIGFHCVPGHHDGEHLAHAFLLILDRLRIAIKIGWISLDNASNNDTFMRFLESELRRRHIPFDAIKRHIRCFAHIVNLACKAVLGAITDLEFAASDAADFEPASEEANTFGAVLQRDPIALVRTLVRVIRASSLRRQFFSEVVAALKLNNLQLLRDVITRWSSTLLMIDRALYLRLAVDKFLDAREFPELRKYKLGDTEWNALADFKEILSVPHSFQQLLSTEKTPCICNTIPAFEAMRTMWENKRLDFPHLADIITAGLNKLDDYRERADDVPVYFFAILINPMHKLMWFHRHIPEKVQDIQVMFIETLQSYYRTADVHHQTPVRPATTALARAAAILGMDTINEADNSHRQSLETEVNAYLSEPRSSVPVLKYWEDNQHRYPTLFAFALDVLPIQSTSVPSERVFSSAKETDALRRNRLSPEAMEALQMLKFSIRNGRGLSFTHDMDEEVQLQELEELIGHQTSVPEDMHAFIKSLAGELG